MKYIFFFILFFLPIRSIRAEYVLPYPGPMPGNKLYKISRIIDDIQRYWYWGNISKTNYFMDLSDKYLIEAKILFEYKQYVLALDALNRSDEAWVQIPTYLINAKNEKKEVQYLVDKMNDSSNAHQLVLFDLLTTLPETYTWVPEKKQGVELRLKDKLQESLNKRRNNLLTI